MVIKEIFLCAVFVCSSGCPVYESKRANSLNDNLIKIARDEVYQRDHWDPDKVNCEVNHVESGAIVTVWKVPNSPGSVRYVTIASGQVVRYGKGK